MFDPVGCAKYDAVKECRERFFGSDDGGDEEKQRVSMMGMEVGRRCGEVYREAMASLEEKKRRAQTERRGGTEATPAQCRWVNMGSGATRLVCTSNAAFGVKTDGLYRFASHDSIWTKVSEPAISFQGFGTTVFKQDGSGVFGLNADGVWVSIADTVDSFVAAEKFLFGLKKELHDVKLRTLNHSIYVTNSFLEWQHN